VRVELLIVPPVSARVLLAASMAADSSTSN
jgi:hypothetical protein